MALKPKAKERHMIARQTYEKIRTFERLMSEMSAAEIGRLLAEYVHESGHNGWDGHTSKDIPAFARLFEDMIAYHKGCTSDDKDYFKERRFGGVTHFTKD